MKENNEKPKSSGNEKEDKEDLQVFFWYLDNLENIFKI